MLQGFAFEVADLAQGHFRADLRMLLTKHLVELCFELLVFGVRQNRNHVAVHRLDDPMLTLADARVVEHVGLIVAVPGLALLGFFWVHLVPARLGPRGVEVPRVWRAPPPLEPRRVGEDLGHFVPAPRHLHERVGQPVLLAVLRLDALVVLDHGKDHGRVALVPREEDPCGVVGILVNQLALVLRPRFATVRAAILARRWRGRGRRPLRHVRVVVVPAHSNAHEVVVPLLQPGRVQRGQVSLESPGRALRGAGLRQARTSLVGLGRLPRLVASGRRG
mmetsp:Transcript_22222/g.71004  ORF Transcript_22222/g.71004 Transcript_22222/m.71004 type:complete len:277 (-) Transcript_22222:34-864(-)